MEIRLQRLFLTGSSQIKKAMTIGTLALAMCHSAIAQQSSEQSDTNQNGDSEVLNKIITPDLERRTITEDKLDSENWEIGVYFGILSIEDFGSNDVVGARLAYHITEDFFLEANYAQSEAGDTSFERLSGAVQLLTDDQRDYSYYNLSVGYNIFPGEVFIGKNWSFNMAFYLVAGVGNTTFADNDFFTYNVGGGLRFFATDSLAIHFDVRDHIFDSDIIGPSERTHNLEAHLGLTMYF